MDMRYVFNPAKKYRNEPDGLIPRALYLATLTKPCDEIKLAWEGAIMREVNEPDPRFSWHQFLTGMIP